MEEVPYRRSLSGPLQKERREKRRKTPSQPRTVYASRNERASEGSLPGNGSHWGGAWSIERSRFKSVRSRRKIMGEILKEGGEGKKKEPTTLLMKSSFPITAESPKKRNKKELAKSKHQSPNSKHAPHRQIPRKEKELKKATGGRKKKNLRVVAISFSRELVDRSRDHRRGQERSGLEVNSARGHWLL